MSRRNKSCSFDLTDPYEKKLLEYAEEKRHINYSVFIKQLIAERMENEERGLTRRPVAETSVVENEVKVVTDGFL